MVKYKQEYHKARKRIAELEYFNKRLRELLSVAILEKKAREEE